MSCELNSPLMQQSKYFVIMKDKALSGWGGAENKINRFVVGCNSYNDALLIQGNAKLRDEMSCIRISDKLPLHGSNVVFSYSHFSQLGSIWKRDIG